MNDNYLIIPNTMTSAVEFIDALEMGGVIRSHTARLLRYFYVTGWDDGFATLDSSVAEKVKLSGYQLSAALSELRYHGIINMRNSTAGTAVADLLALTTPDLTGFSDLGWWKRVRAQGSSGME